MKGFILTLALFGSAFAQAAMDPASDFVNKTLIRGKQVLEQKSEKDRVNGMCALLKQRVGSNEIGYVWLGEFTRLVRERAAIRQFYAMIPSIIITKAVGASGGGSVSGGFAVNPNAVSRGNNVFAVGLTVTDAKGKSYSGNVITFWNGKVWKIVDAEYMGFSAVNYMGREYQSFMRQEYNRDPARSMPVTALIQSITSESDYVRCP